MNSYWRQCSVLQLATPQWYLPPLFCIRMTNYFNLTDWKRSLHLSVSAWLVLALFLLPLKELKSTIYLETNQLFLRISRQRYIFFLMLNISAKKKKCKRPIFKSSGKELPKETPRKNPFQKQIFEITSQVPFILKGFPFCLKKILLRDSFKEVWICDILNLEIFFFKTKLMELISDSYIDSRQPMIQHLFLMMVSRWRPHRGRWRQKRIIGMTKKVPAALRLCSLCGCSISDLYEFANKAWPWVRIFAKSFGILPLTLLLAL